MRSKTTLKSGFLSFMGDKVGKKTDDLRIKALPAE
jgi:hypothetical protein